VLLGNLAGHSVEKNLGAYEIIGRLAVGGMGEVFQARLASTAARPEGEPDEVALKRLLPAHRSDPTWVKQFLEEAKRAVPIVHPNVVRTYRCFKTGIDYVLVQELVKGRALDYMQKAYASTGAPMPFAAAAYIVRSLLRALAYVHRDESGQADGVLVHRDINPSNILLSVAGEVKLTDFGVAEVLGQPKGDTGALKGTVGYMAPEAVLGKTVDTRSDLYSAGLILWELFANEPLFSKGAEIEVMHRVRDARVPDLEKRVPGLPLFASQIVRKAVRADRAQRFQTATEFGAALDKLMTRESWPASVEALKPMLESE
jgi:serine/threonine-protein kinase